MGVTTMEGPPSVLNPISKSALNEDESNWNNARFEALFFKYYCRVVGVLHRLTGDRARAEELANDVFWKLSRQTWLAQSDGNIGGWLHRTATNLGIDHLRTMGRRGKYEENAGDAPLEFPDHRSPLDEVLRAEKTRRVRAVLARLKAAHAQILILRADGFSYQELADSLGFKRGTIGTMLVRAEAAFRLQYRRMFGHEEAL